MHCAWQLYFLLQLSVVVEPLFLFFIFFLLCSVFSFLLCSHQLGFFDDIMVEFDFSLSYFEAYQIMSTLV
jgi:hypothetical protein